MAGYAITVCLPLEETQGAAAWIVFGYILPPSGPCAAPGCLTQLFKDAK